MTRKYTQKTPEVQEIILQALVDGKSIVKAAELAGVSLRAVRYWLVNDAEFSNEEKIAREIQADTSVDEIAEIYTELALHVGKPDFKDRYLAARIKIDSIKWVAGKQRPGKFGDRVQHDVQGGLEHTIVSKEQRDAAVRAAIDAAKS